MIATVPYSIAVSKLRRPFLSDFFISVRLLKRREKLTEPDFVLLTRAFNRARALHPFYPTAWVFLPDPSADGHCICAPVHPTTLALAMTPVARTAVFAVRGSSIEKSADHRSAGPRYRVWQPRFFDRALPTVKEYNEKVEYIQLNPVRAGLVSHPEDGRWSSYNEYAGLSAEEQEKRWGLIVDRARIPPAGAELSSAMSGVVMPGNRGPLIGATHSKSGGTPFISSPPPQTIPKSACSQKPYRSRI
jgi:hypothetical protein